METKMIDAESFPRAPRKNRASKYDEMLQTLASLEIGKGLVLPIPKGEDASVYQVRIQTGMRTVIKTRGIPLFLGFRLNPENSQLLVHRIVGRKSGKQDAPKAEPKAEAKPKAKAKAKARAKPKAKPKAKAKR